MSRAIGSRYTVEYSPQVRDYKTAVIDIIKHSDVQALKQYQHHHSMTRFQHCLNVSYYSYLMCKRLGLDAKKAARAGMLHDLYESTPKCTREHLKNHPDMALKNAEKSFKLSELEQDVILKHMWPFRKGLPSYPESYVVMITDKYIAMAEFAIFLKMAAQSQIRKHF